MHVHACLQQWNICGLGNHHDVMYLVRILLTQKQKTIKYFLCTGGTSGLNSGQPTMCDYYMHTQ